MAESQSTGKSRSGGSGSASTASKKSSKKTSARKSGATSAPARKSGSKRAPRAESKPAAPAARIAEQAASQLGELIGKEVEGVTALRRSEDGWQVELEVLELRRVPATTDVLATYEVTVDRGGDLEEYRRVRRFVRGKAEDGHD